MAPLASKSLSESQSPETAIADELLAIAYTDQELVELATVLVEDSTRKPTDLSEGVATIQSSPLDADAIDVTLSDWLE